MHRQHRLLASVLLAGLAVFSNSPVSAVEGGTGAYLLGGRDTFAGIVAPPGTTVISNSLLNIRGESTATLSFSGIPVVRPKIDVWVNKLDIAHFFDAQIFGGTAGIIGTISYGWGTFTAGGPVAALVGGLTDTNRGFGDPAITPIIGWHAGNFHWSTSISFLIPAGKYDSATVTVTPPGIDNFLNFGKNRAGSVPNISATWFDPELGFELSAALSFEFSLKNPVTNWQTAPAVILEKAALQHFSGGFALGVAGYAYRQLGEDSGTGVDAFRAVVGARSLEARVFGVGPIATYSTRFGTTPVTFKAKYTHEFEGRRRIESDVVMGASSPSEGSKPGTSLEFRSEFV